MVKKSVSISKNIRESQHELQSVDDQLLSDLQKLTNYKIYPRSITPTKDSIYYLAKMDKKTVLCILSTKNSENQNIDGKTEIVTFAGRQASHTIAPADTKSAKMLQSELPFLNPRLIGLHKSAGCGDRLGLATPGHIRAIRISDMSPILAQQSIRENSRTKRSPTQVLDDAMWGTFQEGWRNGYGADADHLKTTEQIDLFASAGFTQFTIDSCDYIDNRAVEYSSSELAGKVASLPWSDLESDPKSMQAQMVDKEIDLGNSSLTITLNELLLSAAKFGRAVTHVLKMYRHLENKNIPFELEISIDEADATTTIIDHIYIVSELQRLGVKWIGFAPRFPGRFEKGVDYIGDLDEFERVFSQHAAVAIEYGPYKLSLHSGSDKFRIYPVAAQLAGELIHLKTSGTSYLEALRVTALKNPALFRQILKCAVECYPEDRLLYHVSANLAEIPLYSSLQDEQLPGILNDFNVREVLHVTYGSVLENSSLRDSLYANLIDHEETYYSILEDHFNDHFSPFRNTIR